jgi:hypothetical protein
LWRALSRISGPLKKLTEPKFGAKIKRPDISAWGQGCQMEYFHTKNPNLGTFLRALEWKILENFMAIGNIFVHLVYFMALRYTFRSIGIFFPIQVFQDVPRKIWQPRLGLGSGAWTA